MTYFVVTSRRVIYRTGVIAKRGVEIPLERVNNINFHQRIIDRIIGAGDLDIESAGKDGQSHFDFIRHPDGVQHEIYRQMEARNMPVAMMAARARGGRARRSGGGRCPSRSSSSPACATRATSPTPSTRPRRRSSSAGCSGSVDRGRAPSTARATNTVGSMPGGLAVTQRGLGGTSSAWLRCTSATTQPPNPAPVRRAPGGAALDEQLDEQVELGRRHPEVVAQAGVAGEQQRAEHATGRRRQCGRGLQHARVLGDDVSRARVVGAPARRWRRAAPGTPSARRDRLALGAPRRVLAPASVRGTPQCTTSTAIPGGSAPARRSRRGSRSAARGRPGRTATPAGPSARPAPRWPRLSAASADRAASTRSSVDAREPGRATA